MAAKKRSETDLPPKKFLKSLQVVKSNLKLKHTLANDKLEHYKLMVRINEKKVDLIDTINYILESLCRIYAAGMNLRGEYAPEVNDRRAIREFPDDVFRKHFNCMRGLVIKSKDEDAKADLEQIRQYVSNTKLSIKRVRHLLGKN